MASGSWFIGGGSTMTDKPRFVIPGSASRRLGRLSRSGLTSLSPVDDQADLSLLLGGKGSGLLALEGYGLKVPDWGVITTAFTGALPKRSTAGDGPETVNLESAIRERGGTALRTLYRGISRGGRCSLAVRSSAAGEDGVQRSWAGFFHSVMDVRGFDDFIVAVARVIDSGRSRPECNMAVLVQRFIQPRSAGVAFSIDPVTGNRNHVSVSGVWGHAGMLVSGEWQGDSFLFDSFGDEVMRSVVNKEERLDYRRNPEGGPIRNRRRKAGRSSFTDRDLAAVQQAVRMLEEETGHPVDMEFLFSRRRLYLVQLRPVTAVGGDGGVRCNYRVWDNSNIIESYAGITLPLTFSYIRYLYSVVYREFFKSIGIPGQVIEYYKDIYPRMLGYFRGRVYYNLINWYLVVAELPGFRKNKGYMELMMGVGKTLHHIPAHRKKGLAKYFYYLPRRILTTIILGWQFLFMTRLIQAFVNRFDGEYEEYRNLDLETMTSRDILVLADRIERKVLFDWKAPIVNDVKAMILYGVLKEMTGKYFDPSVGPLHNRLLAERGDMISVRAVRALEELSDRIREDEELSLLFSTGDSEMIDRTLSGGTGYTNFNNMFREYLRLYGHRSVEELKLETISNREDPAFCIRMLQNYLDGSADDPKMSRPDYGESVGSGENRGDIELGKLGVIQRISYRFILNQTGRSIRDREEQRFRRSSIFDFIRELTAALGKRWKSDGILDDARDIHYLTIDEIRNNVEGNGVDGNLRRIVTRRKAEFVDYRKKTLPNRFITFGDAGNAEIIDDSPETGSGPILGEGCSPGIVEAPVVIIEKPDSGTRLNGEIVVARQTDPGWTILYPAISGLLVERGSMLSHSAIVAREMGLPAIVGLTGIADRLKTGQKVRMDGSIGTVEVLD